MLLILLVKYTNLTAGYSNKKHKALILKVQDEKEHKSPSRSSDIFINKHRYEHHRQVYK
jgi:hypothetical protein